MKPEDVLTPLLKRIQLPDSVVQLLYYLLLQDIQKWYPAFLERQKLGLEPTTDAEQAVAYIEKLLHVFQKLPKIRDLDDSAFFAPLKDLANLTNEDYLYLLPRVDDLKQNQIDGYINKTLPNTLYHKLLNFNVSFDIPRQTRFEHVHILADTGMGKSVLLRHLITQDISTNAAIIVLSPKGALIPELLRHKDLDPGRLVYISPDYDLTLNPFDLGIEDEEIRTNQAIALLDYMFDSMMDAKTTPKQTPLLNYCLRLLLRTPGGSFPMLMDLLHQDQLPESYRPHLEGMDTSVQDFFNKQFAKPGKQGYHETKQELLWRIDNILGAATQRMFSGATSSVKMPAAMAEGKVVLVNTSSKVLGVPGSSFLGRFFLGITAISTILRDGQNNVRPAYLYLDEVDLYASSYLQELLVRGREARVGVTLAHQWLSQLKEYEQSAYACSTKFVGGLQNPGDAGTMARMMKGAEPATLQHQLQWHFHLQVRGLTRAAVPMNFSGLLKYLERQDKRSEKEMQLLMRRHSKPVASPHITPLLKAAEPEAKYTPDPGTGASPE